MPGVYDSTQTGKREDLEDMLYGLEVEATPFTSAIVKSGEATNNLFEWQAERQANPSLDGEIDGADLEEFTKQDRILMQGRTMQFKEGWFVSDEADTNDVAAIKSERAKQKMEALRRIRMKLERFALSNIDSRAGTSLVKGRSRGAFKWLDSAAQSDLPVDSTLRAGVTRYTGALNTITEDILAGHVGDAFKRLGAGVDLYGYCGIDLLEIIDQFSVLSTTRSGKTSLQLRGGADPKRYVQCIKFLEFTAGTVQLHPTRDLAYGVNGAATDYTHRSGLFLNPKVWKVRTKMKLRHTNLEDKGGGPRGYFKMIAGLQCGTPDGQFSYYISADS